MEKAEADVQPLPRENLKSLLSYYDCQHRSLKQYDDDQPSTMITHAVWEDQEPLVLCPSGIRGPEWHIVTVIVALPGQTRETLFSIDVGNKRSSLRRGSAVVAADWCFSLEICLSACRSKLKLVSPYLGGERLEDLDAFSDKLLLLRRF